MRLPDDHKDKQGLTPTVVTALMAVTLFVAVILIMVLVTNNKGRRHQSAVLNTEPTSAIIPEATPIASGGVLKPEDLDFWDKYPQATIAPRPSMLASPSPSPTASLSPSEDGKHTLVINPDGKEEWVLISPYLPKNDYDLTKLVLQSNIMKYYVDGRQVSYVGAEISEAQNYVDFNKLKKYGLDYVMLRIGSRGYGSGQINLDEYFQDNIKRAKDAGLKVGVYFTSEAVNQDEAIEEVSIILAELSEYRPDYPVALDMRLAVNDRSRIDDVTRADKTVIAKTFLDAIKAEGLNACIYGDKEWLIKEIDMSKLTDYDVWLRQAADIPDYPYKFTMWTYMDNATVDGSSQPVSLNMSFIDYSQK
ncbi:MAG: hypothetical protein IJ608_08980 [Lachnospiraceae bacterium]|nr:hypothetical protein [Lachnospiraceae bacterium]